MIRLAGNDAADRAACLAGLNLCFPGWGDACQFDWCYNRPSDPRPADLMVAEIDGAIVAGLAVVYRRIGRDNEPCELVGVLSGAWTHPDARGNGLLGRLIDQTAEIARTRGATMVVAFVTGAGGSVGQLQRRSAHVIAARIFSSDGSDEHLSSEAAKALPPDAAALAFAKRGDRVGKVSIVYDPPSWRSQMIDRAIPGRVVQLGEKALVVVAEQRGGSMILDALPLDPEAFRPALSGPVKIYVSDPEAFAGFASPEWTSTEARIFQIPLAATRYLGGDWHLSGGDRM